MLLLLLTLIGERTDGYETTVNNTAILDIFTTQLNGASVSILNTDVTVDNTNNEWDYTVNSMIGYHMSVNLDQTWGFHPTKVSNIQFELDSNDATSSGDRDLIISFSVAASQYISNMIEIDNSKDNWIYPGFDQQIIPNTPLAIGNVLSLVNTNNGNERVCKASNNICNSCCNMPTMLQHPNNNQYPLIWKFQNDPIHNQLHFEFTNPTWSPSMAQKCAFSTSFAPNNGFQIYISGDDNTETFSIKSFKLTYSITEPPTLSTTGYPTNDPTNIPTNYPSFIPSDNPTQYPTNLPTKYPSMIPSINPTKYPTNFPTKYPTNSPSEYPTEITVAPITLQPTLFTTQSVISLSPTLNPTINHVQNGTEQVMQAPIDETTVIPTDSIVENDDTLKGNNYFPIYVIILAVIVMCIACIGIVCVFYMYRKKKKSIMEAFGTRNKMDITRMNSTSATLQTNKLVMSQFQIEKEFGNNILMDDVVSDVFGSNMRMSAESDCHETAGGLYREGNEVRNAMIGRCEIKSQVNIEMIHINNVHEDMVIEEEGYDATTPNKL